MFFLNSIKNFELLKTLKYRKDYFQFNIIDEIQYYQWSTHKSEKKFLKFYIKEKCKFLCN